MSISLTQTLSGQTTEARLRHLSTRLGIPKSRALDSLLKIDPDELVAALQGTQASLPSMRNQPLPIDAETRLAIATAVREHLEALTTVNEHIVREAARQGVASALQTLLDSAEESRE